MPLDQLVDLAEVPTRGYGAPIALEPLRIAAARQPKLRVRIRELLLVEVHLDLDRAQSPHPRRRPAERRELRARIGAEVPQPLPQRRTGERILDEVLLERLALASVARRLRPRHALPQDGLTLPLIHAASLPAAPMSQDVEGQVRTEELDPEREARRQLALAQIRQYPDPVLRMEARPVAEFDDDLRRLVARMRDLMQEANGVGLAATQVGVLRRVFVFSPEEDKVFALVNPEIPRRADEMETDDEGCLSIQGVTVPVDRATSIRLEGRDENGNEVGYDLEGMAARIAQHEFDHLQGTLMLDRTTPEARREAMAALRPRLVLR